MSGGPARVFEFGAFRLVPEEALLLRDHEPVSLSPKLFKLLCILIENAGHLVEKDELMRALWPDTYVAETNLTYNISVLRKTLGNGNGNGNELIATVAKRGYRFVAPVKAISGNGDGHPARGDGVAAELEHPRTDVGVEASNLPARIVYGKKSRFAIAAVVAVLLLIATTAVSLRRAGAISPAPAHSKWSRNAEANQLLQRGQFILDRRVPDSGTKGLQAVEQSLAKEPNFPLAHATAALAYMMNGDNKLALAAARRAVELDPNLAEAHSALGLVSMFCDWEWKRAEQEFKQAIALDPSYPRAHHWYGIWLELQGQFPRAEQEMRRAMQLEPNFPALSRDLAELLYYEHRYEEAAIQAERTMDLDPGVNEHGLLESIYLQQHNHEAALEQALISARMGNPERFDDFANASQKGGMTAVLKLEISLDDHNAPSGFLQARNYARLGETQPALKALKDGYKSHDFLMPFMAVDPALDPLRSDPQFIQLLNKMGLSRN